MNDLKATENKFIKELKPLSFVTPVSLSAYRCVFDRNQFHDDLFKEFKIERPQLIKNSVVKRRAEFLAGRYTAQMCLKNLGIESHQILIGQHRNPIWPVNIAASISHSDQVAICAALYKSERTFIGIDFENWLTSESAIEIKNSIIQHQEEKLLKQSSMAFNQAFTLAFSAKESLFKALYPAVESYFDFSAAQIIDISLSQNTFTLMLSQNLSTQLKTGTCFSGEFITSEAGVITLLVVLNH